MQDRFKFNAVVSSYYDIDTPEEYKEVEPLIILDNIDVLNNGEVGLMEDELETAIREQHSNLNSAEISHILEYFNNNSNGIDDYVTITPEVVYQSTGLKDKNGKLVFFDDLVKNKWGEICKVIMQTDEKNYGRVVLQNLKNINNETNKDVVFIPNAITESELIGNIYENPELLKEVK